MIRVYLDGDEGIGTQAHQSAMYRPAFERHPAFTIVDTADEADVVSVVVALNDRAAAIEDAIKRGKHVLADKPLAATAAEARVITSRAKECGVAVVPAHYQRLGSALRSARAAIRAGRVGLPWNVQCDFLVAGGDPSPIGELANLAVHPVDAVRALLGLEVRRVHAVGGGTLVTLLLDHDNGVTSTIVCGRSTADVQRYRISGSHGVLAVDATKPSLLIRNTEKTHRTWTGPGPIDALLDVLATAVRTGKAELGPDDAIRALDITEAAQRSLDTGSPVELTCD